jgi:hypothetical protein
MLVQKLISQLQNEQKSALTSNINDYRDNEKNVASKSLGSSEGQNSDSQRPSSSESYRQPLSESSRQPVSESYRQPLSESSRQPVSESFRQPVSDSQASVSSDSSDAYIQVGKSNTFSKLT